MKSYRLFKQVVKDSVTEHDGESFDITRVLTAIGTFIYFGLSIYTVILDPKNFNYINWGIGFSSIIAAGAAGIKIKESNEQNRSSGSSQQVSEKI